MTSDQHQKILARIRALDVDQLSEIAQLLDTFDYELLKADDGRAAAGQVRTGLPATDPWARFNAPRPIRGAHNLANWKREMLLRPPGQALYELPKALIADLTLDSGWPIDRAVHHPQKHMTVAYSSRFVKFPRVHTTLLTQLLTDRLRAVHGDYSVIKSDPYPLTRIPRVYQVQQSTHYRYMQVRPTTGIDARNYPVAPGAPSRPAIDVTRLSHCLMLLGESRHILWRVSKHLDKRYIILRDPYFLILQELVSWPSTTNADISGASPSP